MYPQSSQPNVIELWDDSETDEPAGGRGSRSTQSLNTSVPEPAGWRVVEVGTKPQVSQEVKFTAWKSVWTFCPASQMATALHSCVKKLLETEKQRLVEKARNQNLSDSEQLDIIVLRDYYNKFLRGIILEAVRASSGSSVSKEVPRGDDEQGHCQNWMIVNGEMWEFLSIEHKASALKDAMEKLSKRIDGYLTGLREEFGSDVSDVVLIHHRLRVERPISESLREHGAKESQISRDTL